MMTTASPSATTRSRAQERSSRWNPEEEGRSGFSGGPDWAKGSMDYSGPSFIPRGASPRQSVRFCGFLLRPGAAKYLKIMADAECESGVGIIAVDPGDGRGIPRESANDNLNPQATLPAAFRSHQRRANLPRGLLPGPLGNQMDAPRKRIRCPQSIAQLVVLRGFGVGRRKDRQANAPEGFQAAEVPLHDGVGQDVGGIVSDAAGLVAIGHGNAKAESHGRTALALIENVNLGQQRKVSRVIGRIGAGQGHPHERRPAGVDLQKTPRRPGKLALDDLAQT